MYEQFGAAVTGSAVEFRLYFPDNTKDSAQYTTGAAPHRPHPGRRRLPGSVR